MRPLTLGWIAVACLGLTIGTAMLTARGQQSRPGEIGENHVLVDNHLRDQESARSGSRGSTARSPSPPERMPPAFSRTQASRAGRPWDFSRVRASRACC
jgi:hypothetical protein